MANGKAPSSPSDIRETPLNVEGLNDARTPLEDFFNSLLVLVSAEPIMSRLPIEDVLPPLLRTLTEGRNALLTAAPGAGKTTRVPLALLDAPWLNGKTLLMLEPRRLAARAAAHRMATTLGESVGETIGYRMRLDTKVGPGNRIEVVTEGILARLLQQDPALSLYAIVLFDELHE